MRTGPVTSPTGTSGSKHTSSNSRTIFPGSNDPSAKSGGSLGSFEPGKMVREFDEVCFDPEVPVGEVTGPVRTQFGYHLILVEDRFQNMDRTEGSSVF